jgi:hypothetical protein
VPFAVREQWAAEVVRLLDALLAASAQAAHSEGALDNLLALPRRFLDGRANGSARRTRGRLQRLQDADSLEDELAEPAPPPTAPNRLEHHRTAARIHRCLAMGSISRAARSLDAQPILAPTE